MRKLGVDPLIDYDEELNKLNKQKEDLQKKLKTLLRAKNPLRVWGSRDADYLFDKNTAELLKAEAYEIESISKEDFVMSTTEIFIVQKRFIRAG